MANKANLANSVLFAPLSDSATSLSVYTGDGALFPAVPFYITLSPKNKWSRKINSEIVLVTAQSTDTFTITRAQKGTTAKAFDYGDLVANGIYTEDLDDLQSTIMQAMMPVGFVVTLGVSTNPATLFGFGTWTAITGKVIVGKASSGTFTTLNGTGGAETHTHPLSNNGWALIAPVGNGQHVYRVDVASWTSNHRQDVSSAANEAITRTHGVALRGATDDGSSMPPYIVKYVWERTA